MLSIQCDDSTAAAIVVDDVTEISMTQDDWEISGRPTIGDTISFVLPGDGAFVDAFAGTTYLVTDEFERDGQHIVSFADASADGDISSDGTWLSYGSALLEGEAEVADYAFDSGDDEDISMGLLSEFPGIRPPDEGSTTDGDSHGTTIRNMPSMRLMGALMSEHGMSMRDIIAGLVAMESESPAESVNEDVIVDFFRNGAEAGRSFGDEFAERKANASAASDGASDTQSLRAATA